MESNKNKKTSRTHPAREDVTQSTLAHVFIGQMDLLRNISAENTRAAQAVRDTLTEATRLSIKVDTQLFERLTDNAVYEMKTQIKHLKQPPLVLKVIIMMFVVSVVSSVFAGYWYNKSKEYKSSRMYWYEQYEEATKGKK